MNSTNTEQEDEASSPVISSSNIKITNVNINDTNYDKTYQTQCDEQTHESDQDASSKFIENNATINDNDNNNNSNNKDNDNDEVQNAEMGNTSSSLDDDIIPTAIVIKNIPFAIKREQLLDVLSRMDLPLPYAFNYHFDNGVFRGLAFANFTNTEETTAVIEGLNGKEIGGRKLRVEYKKMLPQAERERLEREKRGKRGQLEEQHNSTSNLSLSSMGKTSTNPLSTNQSSSQLFSTFMNGSQPHINGNTTANTSQQYHQQSQQQQQQQQQQPLLSAQNTANSYYQQQQQQQPQQQQQQQQHQQISTERYYAPLPSSSTMPLPPQQLDFNDPDTLEIFSQLLVFKHKEQMYHDLAYPIGLSATYKRIINVLCSYLHLSEVYDPSFIIIRRKVLDQASLQNHLQQQGQMTMMHPLQANSTGGSMNRSQSYTSLLQAHAAASVSAQVNHVPQSPLLNNSYNMSNSASNIVVPPAQPLTSVQQMQHKSKYSASSNQSSGTSLLLQSALQNAEQLGQQSPQSFINQPAVHRSSSRIPSGYSSNQLQMSMNSSNPLLRKAGVSPPTTQVQTNSNQQRLLQSFYSQPSHSSTQLYDQQYQQQQQQQQQPISQQHQHQQQQLNTNVNNTHLQHQHQQPQPQTVSQQQLLPQNTNGSLHSNYSVHSFHENAFGTNLEEGLTRSLSGLDLQSHNNANNNIANKKSLW
ncbi:Pin4p NDAI_0A01780 [Naumovozyma dairenensis CBS 421]|uniref:RRM domain-containing protein n=1 Tax=Naumovozyma dairenensis (strain ATCC 10597 / BCRC 20456 / CBS 421 / NBRC 0211 / NRRL Y-12639) TaxID=1071378 RepID=G0W3E8_NAUDC|nr:hypothetical protein NDAI_0A01780 [Naumovozyma dairenensis CBS 421]CCD22336.1 hypothetical protein NDAI_0A01780 [Naumovozyma dairenensis CBS 421]